MAREKRADGERLRWKQVNYRTFRELQADFQAAIARLTGANFRGPDGGELSESHVIEMFLAHLVLTVEAGTDPARGLMDAMKSSHRAWVDRLQDRPRAGSSGPPAGLEQTGPAGPGVVLVEVEDLDRVGKVPRWVWESSGDSGVWC